MTVVSASLIIPLVGTVPGRPHVVASPDEVERVFDVALRDLADPGIFHEERWSFPGSPVPGSPDGSFGVWFFEVEGEMIWGATARMIHESAGHPPPGRLTAGPRRGPAGAARPPRAAPGPASDRGKAPEKWPE